MNEPTPHAAPASTAPGEPFVTVIICTRNRAKQLAEVLESATAMSVPPGLHWEFIVVDNGSTDDTAGTVARFADRLPIRCVREERPGLSSARNCGVRAARGAYICWTDDDVVIDPNWLSAYVEAFRRHPEAAVFGGRVIPVLQSPTPDWFAEFKDSWPLNTMLAQRDFGDAVLPVEFAGGRTPYGANFAIRTIEQKGQVYNVDLGVSPSHKRVGEETDVIYKILKAGGCGWWVPGSKVNHIIPIKRQTFRYVYDYARLAGETFAYLRHTFPGDNYLLALGKPPENYHLTRWQLYRRIMSYGAKFCVWTMTRNTSSKLHNLRWLGFYIGMVSFKGNKALGQGHGGKPAPCR